MQNQLLRAADFTEAFMMIEEFTKIVSVKQLLFGVDNTIKNTDIKELRRRFRSEQQS
jgi:hypothetical protein